MKKILAIFMFMFTISFVGFAQTNNANDLSTYSDKSLFEELVDRVANIVKAAPSGTTYGITGKTNESYTVNTPIGEYQVAREDGGVRIFGIWAKLVSSHKGVYVIDSSLGKFELNINKCTVKKQ